MTALPLLLIIYAGFAHAFEADHLLAVSNIVSSRNNMFLALKDGVSWGLGHTSTIFIIGVLIILFQVNIPEYYFHYFEATVGLMLISLAIYRLIKLFRTKKIVVHSHVHEHDHAHTHSHLHVHVGNTQNHSHSLAYGVGLVHGLAGSGALVLMAMTQIREPMDGILYLLIFGFGSIVGMLVAASLFSIPFSGKIMKARILQIVLVCITSALCLGYGIKVIYENLFA